MLQEVSVSAGVSQKQSAFPQRYNKRCGLLDRKSSVKLVLALAFYKKLFYGECLLVDEMSDFIPHRFAFS